MLNSFSPPIDLSAGNLIRFLRLRSLNFKTWSGTWDKIYSLMTLWSKPKTSTRFWKPGIQNSRQYISSINWMTSWSGCWSPLTIDICFWASRESPDLNFGIWQKHQLQCVCNVIVGISRINLFSFQASRVWTKHSLYVGQKLLVKMPPFSFGRETLVTYCIKYLDQDLIQATKATQISSIKLMAPQIIHICSFHAVMMRP